MTPLHPGDRLDHYLLEELVSVGGMATVFRAVDTRTMTMSLGILAIDVADLAATGADLQRRAKALPVVEGGT